MRHCKYCLCFYSLTWNGCKLEVCIYFLWRCCIPSTFWASRFRHSLGFTFSSWGSKGSRVLYGISPVVLCYNYHNHTRFNTKMCRGSSPTCTTSTSLLAGIAPLLARTKRATRRHFPRTLISRRSGFGTRPEDIRGLSPWNKSIQMGNGRE